MINQIDQAFYRAQRKPDSKINFLWYPYNGIFEYLFSQYDFVKYIYSNKETLRHEWRCDDWSEKVNFFPQINFINSPIDVCIANNRQSQVHNAAEVARSLHSPMILIDHEPAADGSRSGMIKFVNKKMPKNTVFVACHKLVQESWMYKNDNVINYGFKLCNRDVQKDREYLLIGDYAESDANLVPIIKQMLPEIETCGYNINTESYGTVENLIQILSRFKITISAAQSIQPPILQLLAASQNCLVITSANKWTENIFEDGKNALLYYSIDDLNHIIKRIKDGNVDIEEIVYNARQMIDEDYNFEDSQSKWKKLLTDVSNRTFVI